MWKEEDKFSQYINYDKVEEYRDFGGIRIEDDILISNGKKEILTKVTKELIVKRKK